MPNGSHTGNLGNIAYSEGHKLKRQVDVMERDIGTLREKIARLAEQDRCEECVNWRTKDHHD